MLEWLAVVDRAGQHSVVLIVFAWYVQLQRRLVVGVFAAKLSMPFVLELTSEYR